jgi:hypothetical protein
MMGRIFLAVIALLSMVPTLAAQVTFSAYVGHLERRLSDGAALEHQRGVIVGGSATMEVKRVAFQLTGAGGKLTAQTAGTPDVDYARVVGQLRVSPVPWLVLSSGTSVAAYVSPAGTQRWVLPQLGAELRIPFNNIPASAYAGGSAILAGSTNGPAGLSGGMILRTGATVGVGQFRAFVAYELERLNFDPVALRQEQRSERAAGLRLRL